jgi:hypothetical protein
MRTQLLDSVLDLVIVTYVVSLRGLEGACFWTWKGFISTGENKIWNAS